MTEVNAPYPEGVTARRHSASVDHDAFRNRHRTKQTDIPLVDRQFLVLVDAYQAAGGLAWIGDLEAMFMLRPTRSAKEFSDAIDQRQVVKFEWHGQVWLPLFQFDLIRMQTHPALGPVLESLNRIYSDWEVADWFSRGNPWLDDRSPAQTLAVDSAAVIDAACAEVFIARG